MARVSIHIVAWNSMRYLPDALRSIFEQTYRDFSVIVVDNGSSDGVEEWVRNHFPEVIILRNTKNLGFARAHNQAIALARSIWEKSPPGGEPLVLVTNPDIVLTPTFLETMVRAADSHPETGSLGGKLRKIFSPSSETGQPLYSNIIDTTGLRLYRSRRFVERGAGEEDRGQFDQAGPVFGVSGALALYRLSALEAARYDDEYFDDDFFAYKEDVDLAWRLQLLGFDARYESNALAYHWRGAYGSEKRGVGKAIRERKIKSPVVNFLSTRNQCLLLIKNDERVNLFRHLLWILPAELGRFLWVLLREPATLSAYLDCLRLRPKMKTKRAAVFAKRQRSAADIRKWFV